MKKNLNNSLDSITPVTLKLKNILKREMKHDTLDIFSKENLKFWGMVASAKKEICIACISLDQIFLFDYIQVFKSMLRDNIKLKILVCDPRSDLLKQIKDLTGFPDLEENLTSCLSKLCNMKVLGLSTRELANCEIRTYKDILTNNIIIIDRDIENGGIELVEPLLFGIESKNRKICQVYKRKNPEIFELYYKSFSKLWDIGIEYSCEWEEL